MTRAYLLVYDDRLGSREDVKRCINDIREIYTWRYDLPNCFYIVSDEDASTLSKIIRERLGVGRFLIVEITSNKGGWLTSKTWYLLNKKTLPPRS